MKMIYKAKKMMEATTLHPPYRLLMNGFCSNNFSD